MGHPPLNFISDADLGRRRLSRRNGPSLLRRKGHRPSSVEADTSDVTVDRFFDERNGHRRLRSVSPSRLQRFPDRTVD